MTDLGRAADEAYDAFIADQRRKEQQRTDDEQFAGYMAAHFPGFAPVPQASRPYVPHPVPTQQEVEDQQFDAYMAHHFRV